MMPQSHRRRSSKESRTRDDHSFDVAAVLDSGVLRLIVARVIHRSDFPHQ